MPLNFLKFDYGENDPEGKRFHFDLAGGSNQGTRYRGLNYSECLEQINSGSS